TRLRVSSRGCGQGGSRSCLRSPSGSFNASAFQGELAQAGEELPQRGRESQQGAGNQRGPNEYRDQLCDGLGELDPVIQCYGPYWVGLTLTLTSRGERTRASGPSNVLLSVLRRTRGTLEQ